MGAKTVLAKNGGFCRMFRSLENPLKHSKGKDSHVDHSAMCLEYDFKFAGNIMMTNI